MLVGTIAVALLPAGGAGASDIASSSNITAATASILQGVSCRAATDCTAVGYSGTSSVTTLIEHWNGTAWNTVPSPNVTGATNNVLLGVSCRTATDCTAVGYSVASSVNTLIEHWNGTTWHVKSSPNATGSTRNFLKGVSCRAATDCTAVGYSVVGPQNHTLIEHWNGTTWSIVSSPDVAGAAVSILYGVSCRAGTDCTAVGTSQTGSSFSTLIEHWDGTMWSIVSSANVTGATNNQLLGVSCRVAAPDCTAVGVYGDGSSSNTLIERWTGTIWTIVSSPNAAGATTNSLYGVSCRTGTDCTAAGYSGTSSSFNTLIERWNGATWSVVSSPNVTGATNNVLQGVSCKAATDCTAVGYSQPGSSFNTLGEHWNGTTWSIVSTP